MTYETEKEPTNPESDGEKPEPQEPAADSPERVEQKHQQRKNWMDLTTSW